MAVWQNQVVIGMNLFENPMTNQEYIEDASSFQDGCSTIGRPNGDLR